jgi:hypothetical protein
MGKADDILLDQVTFEDQVKDGDDVIGDATRQNSQLLIVCEKGENKQYPDSGVGVASKLLDDVGLEDLRREIQSEVEGDGQRVESITGDNLSNLEVAGRYV